MEPDNRAPGEAGEKDESGVDEAEFIRTGGATETNAETLRRVEAEVAAAGKQPAKGRRRIRPQQLYSPLTVEVSRRLWRTRAPGSAWALWAELDRLVFERHRNPVRLVVPAERSKCVPDEHTRGRALDALARAGLVEVLERGRSVRTLVRCLWLPNQKGADDIGRAAQ